MLSGVVRWFMCVVCSIGWCMVLYVCVWCGMVLHGVACVAWCCMALCCGMVLYGVAWCCVVLRGVVWCCMVLYGVVWWGRVYGGVG